MTKNQRIFRRLTLGDPGIGVVKIAEDTLMLIVGSYEVQPKTYKSSQNVPIFLGDDILNSTWFTLLIKESDLTFIQEPNFQPDFYKIAQYTDSLNDMKEKIFISVGFRVKEKKYWGYVPKGETVFKIIKIE